MRIVIDAMGGDFAPREIVRGAELAARDADCEIVLVGDREKIEAERSSQNGKASLVIEHTPEYITMDEQPSQALRTKKNASMIVGLNMVREGRAQAFISAGNTGALMEAAVLRVGRIKGVKRPAITTLWPSKKGTAILLDAGANSDSKPEYLVQFAKMGSLYGEIVLNWKRPRVGLLNIGKEESKGTAVILEAFSQLKSSSLNFVGNVEPEDFLRGEVDVAVCDGFVGNLVLKTGEGVASLIFSLIKEELGSSLLTRAAAMLLVPAFRRIKKRMDSSEHGGALLLGINGICIKSHGKADFMTIRNAVGIAQKTLQNGVIPAIVKQFQAPGEGESSGG
ncbi:MAG: phosphate acyltransferase PlsX [Armatimonadetes bacterium]|nr:phosphate acyltransferase PlsX [Armatimonadota bacterium]